MLRESIASMSFPVPAVRAVIIAAFGWIVVGATEPPPAPVIEPQVQSLEPVAQPLNDIATTYRKQSEREDPNQPCLDGKEDRKSDLCAQWKAADAAASSARWAWASSIVGIVSLLGVVAALGLALHSNKIAQDTAKRQLRAYLTLTALSKDPPNIKGRTSFKINAHWKNSGQTPAIDVVAGMRWTVLDKALDESFTFEMLPEHISDHLTVLGPQAEMETNDHEAFNVLLLPEIAKEEKFAYVWGYLDYTDAFKSERRTEFCCRIFATDLGDGNFKIEWKSTGAYNGVDEGCLRKRCLS
jgi:hypothetical protein